MMGEKYLVLTALVALLAACSPNTDDGRSVDTTDEALTMLEAVFEGPHGKLAIGEMMDTVLIRYNVEPSRENYLKIGNMLVAKRKASDGSIIEMEILAHMIGENSGKRGVSFEDQLNKSVRVLEAEIKQTGESESR